jgi:hypothetical protein
MRSNHLQACITVVCTCYAVAQPVPGSVFMMSATGPTAVSEEASEKLIFVLLLRATVQLGSLHTHGQELHSYVCPWGERHK